MSTITQIVEALATLLTTLDEVDQVAVDSYLPPVKTQTVALVFPPFGQESLVQATTPARSVLMQSHRIPCEFWCKLSTGNVATTVLRAREIGLAAIRLLVSDQSLGGTVSRVGHYGEGSNRLAISALVEDRPVEVGGVPYIICKVVVPVIDYANA